MSAPINVALLGFSNFERSALLSHIKLAEARVPGYRMVLDIEQARFVIADAEQLGVAELLHQLGRTADAVFVGADAPTEAAAWVMRPIDPANLLRALDRVLEQREFSHSQPMPLGLPSGHGALRGSALASAPAPERQARRVGDAAAAPGATRRNPRPGVPVTPPQPQRALLVDDSEVALHFLQRLLRPYGLPVDFAYDSAEALERLAVQAYGIVFLDVDLGPGSELNGLALCQHIKHEATQAGGPTPSVVLVSAFHDAVHRVRGTLAGADAYLGKPLDPQALRRFLAGLGLRQLA